MKDKKKKVINILIIVIALITCVTGIKAATILASSVTYGDKTVEDALDELIEIAKQCPDNALCSKVKLGDYVKMTPTSTSYTVPESLTGYSSDQTINPSELNLWRVIAVNLDGTIDMVSEYVSSNVFYFYGIEGYTNYVGTLNLIAEQYGNSKYTIRTRHMGYNGQTSIITDTSKITYSAPWITDTLDNSNDPLGGGDLMYEDDYNLIRSILGDTSANVVNTNYYGSGYYIASRSYYYNDSNSYEYCILKDDDGTLMPSSTYYIENGNPIEDVVDYGLRPIVTLRADVTTSSGSGTSSSPWLLS